MQIRLLAALLVMVLLLTACGNKSAQNGVTTAPTGDTTAQTDPTATDPNEPIEPEDPSVDVDGPFLSAKVELKKQGTVSEDAFSNYSQSGFLHSYEDGGYRLLDLNGNDTLGKTYAEVESVICNGVCVVSEEPVDGVVKLGIVDVNAGKELVPCEAVDVRKLNDRFVEVCFMTEITTDKENSFDYFWEPETNEQVYYNGYAKVLDLEEARFVPGVEVTTSVYDVAAVGETVFVDQDSKTTVAYDPDGKDLGSYEYLNMYPNSGLVLQGLADSTPVYDGKMNLLYELEDDIFHYDTIEGNSEYLCKTVTTDGEKYADYVLVDLSGKEVSAVFDRITGVVGDLVIFSEDKDADGSTDGTGVADMQGNIVIPAEYSVAEYVEPGLFAMRKAEGNYLAGYDLYTKDGKKINDESIKASKHKLCYANDEEILILSTGEMLAVDGYIFTLAPSLIRIEDKVYEVISGQVLFENVVESFGSGDSIFVRMEDEDVFTRYVVQYS